MQNHVILMAGLGSSICPGRYAKWARMLKKTLLSNPNFPAKKTTVHIVSSDGNGENDAVNAVIADHKAGMLGKVLMAGHSNGARDQLFAAKAMGNHGIEIPYVAVIDMTLGEFGAKAGGNIAVLDEFWAALQKVDLAPDFKGKFNQFNLDKLSGENISHMGAAVHPITQQRIAGMIEAELA